jgi:hypothetical protein
VGCGEEEEEKNISRQDAKKESEKILFFRILKFLFFLGVFASWREIFRFRLPLRNDA